MKRILTLALVFGYAVATAQKTDNVGIGTTKPDPSAILDLNTTNKGFLMPRMTETERNAIKNPAMALKVYQIDGEKGEYTFDGTTWQPSARVGATNSVGAWDKQGNAVDGTDFLGTTNAFPLRFVVGGNSAGRVSSQATGQAYFGSRAGELNTGNGNIGLGNFALYSGSGAGNVAIGEFAMYGSALNTGAGNVAIGNSALTSNETGYANVSIGASSMSLNKSGFFNMAIGQNALSKNIGGNSNTAIGVATFLNNTGNFNVGIGFNAGFNNVGSSNIFVGYGAGADEAGSNKLYIANTSTPTPLVYGDFSAKFVSIGDVPDLKRGAVASSGQYSLLVEKGILCEKLKVALKSTTDWADYVFEPEYNLMSLESIEKYTKNNKHLPNVPSAEEIIKDGIDLSTVSKMFMEKIEELTLHVIELNKRIKELENKK